MSIRRGADNTKETLAAKEGYKLRIVRDIADELERLEGALEELRQQTISSPRMDGMPHGSSKGDAMASMLVQKQRMEERVGNASDRLRRAQNVARRIIKPMPAAKRLFYEAYYIENGKLATACAIARVSESTAYRYLRAAGEPEKNGAAE